ncbi:MAG: hypothetical protein D6753_05105 [Planctomycetota bacterium]|nr:MAG: hypothetical protein D6753_05105 [Planctomycetota bacterium]
MATNSSSEDLTLPGGWRGKAPMLLAVGLICVLLSAGMCYFVGGEENRSVGFSAFLHSYLANFIFCLSICLGGLFFVMIQHVARAAWSATIRRVAELLAYMIPWWLLLFLPILAMVWWTDSPALYPWNAGSGNVSAIVEKKLDYLNPFWFTIRVFVYFAVWVLCARYFFGMSRKQDETGDASITLKCQKWAGPGIIFTALATNFGAFDIMMSTDPEWFSTIYGVYLFAASMLSFFAMMIVSCYALQRAGRLQRQVNTEHFHDLAKFQFGFIVFWAYIAFSQFLLYWYGNIPEETQWYQDRMNHGWQYVGLVLIAGHFAIPFLGTMARKVRRSRPLMAFWGVFILVMHWVDMMFVLLPTDEIHFSGLLLIGHLVGWIGMVSVFLGLLIYRTGDTPLVAQRDPWIPDALAYQVGP